MSYETEDALGLSELRSAAAAYAIGHGPRGSVEYRAAWLLFRERIRTAEDLRRWRGALLSHKDKVTFEILEADKRPVSAVADNVEVRDVIQVDVVEDRSLSFTLLFDAGRSLEERVLAEQFTA